MNASEIIKNIEAEQLKAEAPRFPSLIFPYTFTVSPTENCGASAFNCSASMFLIISLAFFL